jgi:hypothetical protein
MGFESLPPDHGSLAHEVEQPVEARQNPIRARGEPPCRTNTMAKCVCLPSRECRFDSGVRLQALQA